MVEMDAKKIWKVVDTETRIRAKIDIRYVHQEKMWRERDMNMQREKDKILLRSN